MEDVPRWWDPAEIAAGGRARWRIAGLEVVAARSEHEWRLSYRRLEPTPETASAWDFENDWREEPEDGRVERHVFSATQGPCRLLPLLADRPVVSSPRIPVYLQPGEEATLYVGTPLWLAVEVGDPPTRLAELPVHRPSDTWFGSSTLEGELCYAARTRAALNVASLPELSDRAVTPVLLRNAAGTSLAVDRLKLPVPFLALWEGRGSLLWTGGVTLVRSAEGTMASLEVEGGAPRSLDAGKLLTAPRQTSEPGRLIRAFSTLFRSHEQVD